MKLAKFAALPVLACLAAAPAMAESGVEVGMLTCKITGVQNAVVYSKESFDCNFAGAGGKQESYVGQITNVGANLSVKGDFTLVWAVFAPAADVYEPGALAGTYVGAGADASVGLGVGAQVLVGGGNSFSLQPLSVSGGEGFGVKAGIQSFELR